VNDQDELFTTQEKRQEASTSSAPSGPPMVATCRSNVLEWLSAGLVTPRAAFDKYYEDSLAIRDDLVPIVRPPVGEDLLDVEGSRAGNFPVMVELEDAAVTWVRDEEVGYVTRGPLGAVRALHFRSSDDAGEFAARVFANLAVDRVPHRVSPALFETGTSSAETIAADLRSVRPVSPAMPFRLADRLSGGRTLALSAATVSVESFEWIVALTFGPRLERSPRRKLKRPEEWVTLTASASKYAPPKNATLDERIFRAATKVFLDVDGSEVGNRPALLEGIDALLAQDEAMKGAERERWSAATRHVRSVLQGDDAFTGFRSRDFRSEKALLLALIRPTPEGVLAWTLDETQATPTELVLAALLVGLAHGRKALPTSVRPLPLDDLLARRELDDLGDGDVEYPFAIVDDGAGAVTLRIDDQDVRTVAKPPPTLVELFEAIDPRDEVVAAALTRAALERGWADAVTTVVVVPNGARIEARRSTLEITMDGVPELRSSLRPDAFRDAIVGHDDRELRELLAGLVAAR
jgi:hypothetical protein